MDVCTALYHFFLALINPLALALALRLHANLHHFEGAVLYPTHLHLENDDGGYGDCEALVLSPVSLDDTDERVWLHPSEDTDTAASAS